MQIIPVLLARPQNLWLVIVTLSLPLKRISACSRPISGRPPKTHKRFSACSGPKSHLPPTLSNLGFIFRKLLISQTNAQNLPKTHLFPLPLEEVSTCGGPQSYFSPLTLGKNSACARPKSYLSLRTSVKFFRLRWTGILALKLEGIILTYAGESPRRTAKDDTRQHSTNGGATNPRERDA